MNASTTSTTDRRPIAERRFAVSLALGIGLMVGPALTSALSSALVSVLVSALGAAPAHAQTPTMDALWPNEDGRSWEYHQVYQDFYQGGMVENEVRLFFNGTDVVPGGIVVQNLEVEAPARPANLVDAELPADPLLRNLWRARPDLRDAIRVKLAASGAWSRAGSGSASGGGSSDFYQVLLREDTYKKLTDEIVAYRRDIVATKSWIWLVEDLTIGNTFELQLVPDFAPDVWLYGTIAAVEDVQVPAGFFEDCVRVDYRINYGESICTDPNGVETGGMTSETIGAIHFAAGVGPVNHREELYLIKEILWGECLYSDLEGLITTSGSLQLTSIPPTPVDASSWGRLKTRFSESR